MKLINVLRSRTSSKFLLLSCFLIFVNVVARAQLCTGSLGDPVVDITFGAGPNPGPPLSPGITTMTYVNFDCPNDGMYAVRNTTFNCFGSTWHNYTQDHTGDPNGYFMVINANILPSDFYVDTVHGLCQGTTFEFAAWITNLMVFSACGGNGTKPNITFSIETTAGAVLSSYSTGEIPEAAGTFWQQYGFYFVTPAGVSDVVIRMHNNAPGGCGNDLGLDDITFRPCGPLITTSINTLNDTVINKCEGDTSVITFSAGLSGGYTSPQYQWQISTDNGGTWTDIAGADSTVYQRQPTGIGRYLYRLAAAEMGNIGLSTCRVASVPLSVNVNPNPVATLVNNGPHCAGGSFTLTAGGGTSYTWAGPGNFAGTGQVVTIANAVDATTYYDTVTNGFNCQAVDSTTLTVYANPVAKFATSLPSCENSAVNYTNQSTVASGQSITQNNWSFGDGTNSQAVNPTHIYAQAGTDSIKLFVSTDKGCKDSTTQALAVHYLPQPGFGLPKVCLTDPFAAFTDSSTIADSTEGGFSYRWNFGDANATASNPDTSNQQNPRHSYTATGVYNVQLTVTSSNGCIKDTVEPFTINGAVPKAGFIFNTGDSICSNTSLLITNTSTVNFGSITKIEVYWNYANDTLNSIIDNSTQPGKVYKTQYPVFDTPALKLYSIKYVAYSGINCVNELDTVVAVEASPVLAFAAIKPVCEGVAPFVFTEAAEINGIAGTGIYTGNATSSFGLFNPQLAGVGTNTITYTYTAYDGCGAFAQQPVQVLAQPTANAGPAGEMLQGGTLVIDATATGPNNTYLWTPDLYIANNQVLMPTVSPAADITYTLTVTSDDGCSAQDSVHITVLKTPLIPNAFSPNGDGINDRWQINYLNTYASNVTVQVFNRYGQLVFSSTGYNTPWDGTLNGSPLPVGTYYYIIDRKVAGAAILTGNVTIVR